MISLKSFITYFYINGFLYGLSLFTYNLPVYVCFLIRNRALVSFIDYGTHSKKEISNVIKNKKIDYNFFVSTAIESLTHCFLINKFQYKTVVPWSLFIFVLFQFEIVLDLFHYFTHRLLHHPMFYRHFHKKHHYYANPCSINTFHQDPFDLIITNSIPTWIALYSLYYKFSPFQMNLVLIYKSFIEISGHVGKQVYPSSSFPICIWLPRLLGIQMYTEDHNLHHSQINCNYSKRFTLWDRVFLTFSKAT